MFAYSKQQVKINKNSNLLNGSVKIGIFDKTSNNVKLVSVCEIGLEI